jgi:hypothetical protein
MRTFYAEIYTLYAIVTQMILRCYIWVLFVLTVKGLEIETCQVSTYTVGSFMSPEINHDTKTNSYQCDHWLFGCG